MVYVPLAVAAAVPLSIQITPRHLTDIFTVSDSRTLYLETLSSPVQLITVREDVLDECQAG